MMNPEIHDIVATMERRLPKNAIADCDINKELSIQSAKLSVLLAEETEAQNKVITKHAEETVRLTRAIRVLTLVMLIIGAVQVAVVVFRP